MRIEPINKVWPRKNFRCSAQITDAGKKYRDIWPETRGDYQCQRDGRYTIDGQHYCFLHAGELAIAHLLKENVDAN